MRRHLSSYDGRGYGVGCVTFSAVGIHRRERTLLMILRNNTRGAVYERRGPVKAHACTQTRLHACDVVRGGCVRSGQVAAGSNPAVCVRLQGRQSVGTISNPAVLRTMTSLAVWWVRFRTRLCAHDFRNPAVWAYTSSNAAVCAYASSNPAVSLCGGVSCR